MDKKKDTITVSIWSQLGPVLLLGSFAVVLLKYVPLYWPLALTAFGGYITTISFKKGGLFLSLFILVAVLVLLLRTTMEIFWPMTLSVATALSWLLIFWGDHENEAVHHAQIGKIQSLEANCRVLEKQLRETKLSISIESKDLIAEKEKLLTQFTQATEQLQQTQRALQRAEQEREKLVEKCETSSREIFAFQRKEAAFQRALEDAQTQLLKLKSQPITTEIVSDTIVPMEENDSQELRRIEQVQHQYANLREQFEEKSETLDQTRKDLFKAENELLILQKYWEEKTYEFSEEGVYLSRDLKKAEEEMCGLESQIIYLQEVITSLLSPKKRASRLKKTLDQFQDQEHLPLILQERIDQVSTESF